jgi:hypothetical protein
VFQSGAGADKVPYVRRSESTGQGIECERLHYLCPDGTFSGPEKHAVLMYASGKKKFPLLLDGEKWKQFPKL